VDFTYIKGKNQYRWTDINLFEDCQNVLAGCPRPDPRYTRILQYGTPARSEYKALLVSLHRRFRNKFGFQVSYTLSKTMNEQDDAGSIADPPSDMFNPEADWGPSLNDQRHVFTASYNVEVPYSFFLSGVFAAGSAPPHKTLAGFDVNGDGSSQQDRPPGVSRNSARTNPVYKLDIRASRVFTLGGSVQLEGIFEVYNLLNHENYDPDEYGTVIGSKTFGQPGPSTADFYQPRQLQLAVRLRF
jgi:hypothetical protein